jgi:hypothetical protein
MRQQPNNSNAADGRESAALSLRLLAAADLSRYARKNGYNYGTKEY